MPWLDVVQNEDVWFGLRVGRFGGSSIGGIMANFGKAFGPPAHAIALRMALEKITGVRRESNYSNAHMERGHEQEPIARQLYEETTFCDVLNGGYFIFDDDIGVSPDGRVGENGLIEIKSVIDTVHFDTIKRNAFDPKYKWQMCLELKVSGRDWIDYVEFCADFPENKRLFIQRLHLADYQKEFDMIDLRVSEFKKLVQEKINIINRIK